MRATLLVVAKAPVPGEAKTRLSPALTAHQAAAVATAALLDTLDAVRLAAAGGLMPVVALTGDLDRCPAGEAVRTALTGFRVIEQRGEDFADRLAAAHLDAAGIGPVVQIGMDTPQVDPELLRSAAERVCAEDGPGAVLGPAADGGWWLLALRRAGDARVLRDVPMSCPDTGARTSAALRAAGVSVESAPELVDVDEVGDLAVAAAAAQGGRFAELVGVLAPGLVGVLAPGPAARDADQRRRADGTDR